mmetsp:Transcript_13978/g.35257  ORF Transcript_13978/g.35257 Transcript_13978/m.35257 type:complete len:230 (-) Transcript_13978:703-1392(-)
MQRAFAGLPAEHSSSVNEMLSRITSVGPSDHALLPLLLVFGMTGERKSCTDRGSHATPTSPATPTAMAARLPTGSSARAPSSRPEHITRLDPRRTFASRWRWRLRWRCFSPRCSTGRWRATWGDACTPTASATASLRPSITRACSLPSQRRRRDSTRTWSDPLPSCQHGCARNATQRNAGKGRRELLPPYVPSFLPYCLVLSVEDDARARGDDAPGRQGGHPPAWAGEP